jgi:DNA primase catalytic core
MSESTASPAADRVLSGSDKTPNPFLLRASGGAKRRSTIDLRAFLENEVLPRLTAETVFTDPAHCWQKASGKWRGGCPWHESKSGTSFYIDPESLLWRCAGCGFGGGPVQYLYRLAGGNGSPRGEEFVNVVRQLASLAGVPFPERELTEQEQEDARRRESRRTILEDVTSYCERALWSEAGTAALAFLHDRGFDDEDIKDLRLGLYDHSAAVWRALKDRGHSRDDVAVCGVLWSKLEGYVTFPWNDDTGRPLTLYGRWPGMVPPDRSPKMLALPNPKDDAGEAWEATKRSPYLLDRAIRAGHQEIVLVEGILDAAVAHARGDTRVVACVAAELSHEQTATLARRGVQGVTICLDPDQAGENGIASCVRQLLDAGIGAYVAPKLPEGLDPDEFILARGIEAWRTHLARAEHAYRHEAHRIIETHRTAEGWTDQTEDAAVKEAVSFAAKQPPERADELRRHFWDVICTETRAAEDDLQAQARAERLAGDGNGTTAPLGEFVWRPIDSTAFARGAYKPEWLVKRLLVRGQPAIIGGPKKSLKTTLLLDLAISLASGQSFFGTFTVYQPLRVALLSGESGEFTLQETACRICRAKGIGLADLRDKLLWQFTLPQLANADHLARLHAGLVRDRVEVLIIDPLYLSLLAGVKPGTLKAENLFDMGPLLQSVTRIALDAGATPLFAHHSRKGTGSTGARHQKEAEPLDLDDLAFAGVAEFARQWLLVSRRQVYEPGTGHHELWLTAGGSFGHGGLWALDIEEGALGDNFDGRTWEVAVKAAAEHRSDAHDQKQEAKDEHRQQRDRADDSALLTALDALDAAGQGASYEKVRVQSRLPKDRMSRAFERLLGEKLVERLTPDRFTAEVGNGARRPCVGIRRLWVEV